MNLQPFEFLSNKLIVSYQELVPSSQLCGNSIMQFTDQGGNIFNVEVLYDKFSNKIYPPNKYYTYIIYQTQNETKFYLIQPDQQLKKDLDSIDTLTVNVDELSNEQSNTYDHVSEYLNTISQYLEPIKNVLIDRVIRLGWF